MMSEASAYSAEHVTTEEAKRLWWMECLTESAAETLKAAANAIKEIQASNTSLSTHTHVMRSQKARGVEYLSARHPGSVPPVAFWGGDTRREVPKYGYPCFARPCPMTPRHGFVDSRVVNNRDEAQAVFDEARAADSQAEMMLMPLIEADTSIVMTPTWAAIGHGHDGATAGKAGALAVQLLYTNVEQTTALIPDGQLPYLEIVTGKYRKTGYSGEPTLTSRYPWFVQLRSGPAIGDQGLGNYIPRDTVVRQIVNAHELDALALEATLNDASANGALEGLVIWQANGNPCSHAACHARLHSIPIVFDEVSPATGTTLTKTSDAGVPMHDAAMAQATRYHGRGGVTLPDSMSESLLWAIHQAPALARSVEGARFVGYACTQLWRYAATACIGEARHSNYVTGGRRRRARTPHRHTIYARALGKAATDAYMRSRVTLALASFSMADNFSSGYGGGPWESCARAALSLYDALAALSAGKGSANDVVLAAHAVVNSAHNNGPFLNKFIGAESFDQAAGGNQFQAARSLGEMFAYVRGVGSLVSHGEGQAWPLRKHKAAKAVSAEHVQWSFRMDNNMLHAQMRTNADGKYLSATLPLSILAPDQIRAIMLASMFSAPTLNSLAKSSKPYWPASGTLSAETLVLLFPTT